MERWRFWKRNPRDQVEPEALREYWKMEPDGDILQATMGNAWRRIRSHWTRTDTLVLGTNTAACIGFIGNCWWQSVSVCYIASLAPITVQLLWSLRHGGSLRPALGFGALVALLWPFGEGIVTLGVGWWGEYIAPGPVVWKTPVYCMLIGWLASTHIFYLGRRTLEFEFGMGHAVANSALTALGVGILGENLFVWAGMWRYHASEADWFSVPAFVPIAYAAGYCVLPLMRSWRLLPATLVWAATLLIASVGLGLATGFFPR